MYYRLPRNSAARAELEFAHRAIHGGVVHWRRGPPVALPVPPRRLDAQEHTAAVAAAANRVNELVSGALVAQGILDARAAAAAGTVVQAAAQAGPHSCPGQVSAALRAALQKQRRPAEPTMAMSAPGAFPARKGFGCGIPGAFEIAGALTDEAEAHAAASVEKEARGVENTDNSKKMQKPKKKKNKKKKDEEEEEEEEEEQKPRKRKKR